MHKQILSIVGPTATGKTKLAIDLAHQIIEHEEYQGVEIISADSRQVYHNFELLSGADLGDFMARGYKWQKNNAFSHPFLSLPDQKIRYHGAAILDLTADWSLGQFYDFARQIITTALEQHRAVILVGGTMLYHDRLFSTNDQISVKPNPQLRAQAESMSLEELQVQLQKIAPQVYDQLNHSDQHNPRRLIRHWEIAEAMLKTELKSDQNSDKKSINSQQTSLPHPWVGLHQYLMPAFDLNTLKNKISIRVQGRFKAGAIDEVKKALALIGDQDRHLALPIGFAEIKSFLNHEISEAETVNLWTLHEWQYAKRQLTWWRKQGLIE